MPKLEQFSDWLGSKKNPNIPSNSFIIDLRNIQQNPKDTIKAISQENITTPENPDIETLKMNILMWKNYIFTEWNNKDSLDYFQAHLHEYDCLWVDSFTIPDYRVVGSENIPREELIKNFENEALRITQETLDRFLKEGQGWFAMLIVEEIWHYIHFRADMYWDVTDGQPI